MDINTANQADLETIKGIGPVKARAIIEHRNKHGVFKSVEDLVYVKGIGDGTLKKLGDQVSVGETAISSEAGAEAQ